MSISYAYEKNIWWAKTFDVISDIIKKKIKERLGLNFSAKSKIELAIFRLDVFVWQWNFRKN